MSMTGGENCRSWAGEGSLDGLTYLPILVDNFGDLSQSVGWDVGFHDDTEGLVFDLLRVDVSGQVSGGEDDLNRWGHDSQLVKDFPSVYLRQAEIQQYRRRLILILRGLR